MAGTGTRVPALDTACKSLNGMRKIGQQGGRGDPELPLLS